MIRYVTLNTFDDLTAFISDQQFDENINRNRSFYLYRGLSNAQFHLETSLKRNCRDKQKDLETPILRNFSKYAASEAQLMNASIWRQMAIGQHHGLPTRLMDWTFSPLMALHFATSGEALHEMDEHDAAVWKIDVSELNRLLPPRYQDVLEKEKAYFFTIDMLNSLSDNTEEYDLEMGNRSMILLEPPSIDQRIINQYSYFSVTPLAVENIEEFLNEQTNNTVCYLLPKEMKWRMRDMLDQMNINERIAFPGLDGLSTWIKRHYYVK